MDSDMNIFKRRKPMAAVDAFIYRRGLLEVTYYSDNIFCGGAAEKRRWGHQRYSRGRHYNLQPSIGLRRMPMLRVAGLLLGLIAMICFAGFRAEAQTRKADGAAESLGLQIPVLPGPVHPATSTEAPLTLTLQDALDRARAYSPQFQAAVTATKMAGEDRRQARASLLPSADLSSQYLGTQGNGILPSGRFVTNDGVHVYREWAVFHGGITANTFTLAGYRRAEAVEALAKAQEEIARRGLTVAVTQAYYGLIIAERKYATAQQSLNQSKQALQISQEQEQAGEAAHSDVIRFQIQYNQGQQAFQEAELAMQNTRLNLAVLLFPNFNQNFNVVDDMDTAQALPTREEVEKMAEQNNPQLRAAMAALRATKYDVSTARAAFFPTLSFDVDYGIEANALALRSRTSADPEVGRLPNLGYFATVTLSIPVWDWGTRRSKLRQAEYQRRQAHVQLTFTERELLSSLFAGYNEARTARSEVDTLRSSADLAAESLRLNTLRYKAGEATVLEVVDAQNTLTQARNAYADGLARYRVAIANLQILTGSF